MIKNLYRTRDHEGETILNTGYDYSEKLIQKSTSLYLFRNQVLNSFLGYINSAMVLFLESVKYIRIYDNFTVNKETKRIN